MINKRVISIFVMVLVLISSISLISAINLLVSSEPIVSSIINDEDKPGVIDFTITNNGKIAVFELYTFERFDVQPKEFSLSSGETRKIRFEFLPIESMRKNVGYIKVPYYIREKNTSDNFKGDFVLKLVGFNNAFDVNAENINPNAPTVSVAFYNVEDISYNKVDIILTSPLFNEYKLSTALKPYEKKSIEIPLNSPDFNKLVSGTYTIKATYTVDGKTFSIDRPVKLLEKTGLSVNEDSSGWIIRKYSIEKKNEGNIPTVADASIDKNIISRLFTTFSIEPNKVDRKGFFVTYYWQKELTPDESLKIISTTNLIFPLLLIIAIIIIVYLFNIVSSTNVILNKRVSFVKTKSNDFALKVTLKVKTKKFVEKLVVYDRLPGVSKLHENYGIQPTKIDHERGRIQWDIPRLAEGEERVFTYIIYSKIKVVGKFELPPATAVFEREGKVEHAKSNKVFFINEPAPFSGDD